MATRRYMTHAQSNMSQITEAVGAATVTKNIEVTVDWDQLNADGISKNGSRLAVANGLRQIAEYIEQTGKTNVKA